MYRIGFATQSKDEEGEIIPEPLPYALHSCKQYIKGILKDTKADSYRLFLTGKDNFREKIVPDYKWNRKDMVKPIHYQALRDYMSKYFKAEVIDGKEADDMLGLCQTEDTMIATIDKDLDIVGGKHFNYVTKKFYTVTPEEGIKNFYAQMLTGDSTDYIAGIKGVGKGTAFKWLEEAPKESWDDLIEEKYKEFHIKAVKKVADMSEEDKIKIKNHDFVAFDRDGWFKTMVQNQELLWMLQKNVQSPMNFKGDEGLCKPKKRN